jgi:hypothetical protein
VALASRHAVPAIYEAGIFAGKILQGAKPADRPVQHPLGAERLRKSQGNSPETPTCPSPLAPVVAGDDAAPEARAVVMRL